MLGKAYAIAYRTIVIKETFRFLRIWVQTILPPAVTTTLYFVIFGKLIGPQIGTMAGYRYIDYIVPGLIMMSVISNAYSNVVSSFYSSKFQRHIEELMIAPIPNWIILAGYVTGGVVRGLAVGVVVMAVSGFFTAMTVTHYVVTVAVLVLTALLFALAGFINAVFAKTFDDISIVPTFILTPLTYLGGVFYSIHLLPGFWKQVSLFNPVLYMVNAFRYGLLGVSDVPVGSALVMIGCFVLVLTSISLYLLNQGIGLKS